MFCHISTVEMTSLDRLAEMIYEVVDRKFDHMRGSCLTATIRGTKHSIQIKTADKSIWFIKDDGTSKLLERKTRKCDIHDLTQILLTQVQKDALFDLDDETKEYYINNDKQD